MSDSRSRQKFRRICNSETMKNQFDAYGQSFFLTFKGQQTYNTSLGAIVSVIVYISFLGYFLYRGYILCSRSEMYTVTNNYIETINYTNPEIENYKDFGFDFAFQLIPILSPDLGSFKATHNQQIRDEDTGKITTVSTNIDYGLCGLDSLNYDDKQEIQLKGFNNYYCLKNLTGNETSIGGNYYSMDFHSVDISLERCVNDSETNVTCASKETQDVFFSSSILQLVIVDQYFDYSDLDVPVKSYLEQRNFHYLDKDYTIFDILQIVPSTASVVSSFLPLVPAENYLFAKYLPILSQRISHFYDQTNPEQYLLEIRLSDQRLDIDRTIYSAMDFLSDIGGLFSTFYEIGKIIVGIYLQKLFYSHIIQQLFQIDLYDEQILEQGNSQQIERNRKCSAVQNYLSKDVWNEDSKSDFQNQLANEIIVRRSFKYSVRDILKYQLSVFRCCKRKSLDYHQQRKNVLYEKAIKKIENQFDAQNLFIMMKQFKIISKLIFSNPQKFILQFQRNQVLNQESSEESEDFLENIQYLNSNNPYQRLKFLIKLKRISKKFLTKGKSKGLDKRLLKGVFSKRLLRTKYNRDQQKQSLIERVNNFFQTKIVPHSEEELKVQEYEVAKQNSTRIDGSAEVIQEYLDFIADEGIVGVLGLKKDLDFKRKRAP